MEKDGISRTVTGTVTYEESGRPAEDVVVHAKDDRQLLDKPLGLCATDKEGHYQINYSLAEYHDLVLDHLDREIEGPPDLSVEVYDYDGNLLASMGDALVKEPGREETIDIKLSENVLDATVEKKPSGSARYPNEYDPVDGVEYLEDPEVIRLVKFSKPNVVVGEPVTVTPVLDDTNLGEETMVTINGVPGSSQILQFTEPGKKRIHVAAFTMVDGGKNTIDQRSITVEVDERDPSHSGKCFQPIVQARQIPRDGLTIEFTVVNADEFDVDDAVYVWDVDGKTDVVTETPRLRYDFEDEMSLDSLFSTFDIGVRIESETASGSGLGRRTVGAWNPDHLNKLRGQLELKTVGTPQVVREGERFILSYELHNPAEVAVEIETRQLEYLTTNEDESSSGFLTLPTLEKDVLREPESVSFSIPPSGSVTRQFEVPVYDAPRDMFGIGLHFFGSSEPVDQNTPMEVFGNVYAERRYNHPLAIPIEDPFLEDVLDNVDARVPGGLRDIPVTIPELVGDALDLPDGCPPRGDVTQVDKGEILERLPNVTARSKSVDGDVNVVSDGGGADMIPDSEDAMVGDRCLPSQDPPDDELACQLTDEYEKVYIPGRILNGRKGDVILSPGSGSAIAELLLRVDPIEVYSHCGIMSQDHLELHHSTANSKWLENQLAGVIEGGQGLDPEALKYAWPGTITQSVEEAYEGSDFSAPDGNVYEISGFDRAISDTKSAGHVWPEVVRPDTRLEYEISGLRALLEDVADEAVDIDGHYRFFAYTDAAEAFAVATTEEDTWWDGTRGTVCSSLIWGAIQELDDPPALEMDESPLTGRDLESSDDGAVVQEGTEDGLYYYYEAERRNAAEWLWDYFHNRVVEEKGPKSRLLKVPREIANQITNTFAFDWSGENDAGNHSRNSQRWRDPGDGNAVSPDTIRNYWDAPSEDDGEIQGLYGHSERLVYRPGRFEERRVRRWKRTEADEATVKITVFLDGDHADHATVEGFGDPEITDDEGEVQFEVGPGSYRVHAHKRKDGWHYSNKREVELGPGETQEVIMRLEEPDDMFRLISASGTMRLIDPEWGEDPDQEKPLRPKLARLGPGTKEKALTWSQTVDGDVTGNIEINLEWQSTGDVDFVVNAELNQHEGVVRDDNITASESGTVPEDDSISMSGELTADGLDDPQMRFDATLQNEKSPT